MAFEILEHTADIGIRADGATLEELFAEAVRGLASIIGIWRPAGPGDAAGDDGTVELDVAAADLGALLVDWLSEALWVHDTRSVAFTGIRVDAVGHGRATGTLGIRPLGPGTVEGLQVKAITYHGLAVEEVNGRWIATLYVDI